MRHPLLLTLSISNHFDLISESAATLEAESGYSMEAPQVYEFRQRILEGSWHLAEESLRTLGVADETRYAVCTPKPIVNSLTRIYRLQSS